MIFIPFIVDELFAIKVFRSKVFRSYKWWVILMFFYILASD